MKNYWLISIVVSLFGASAINIAQAQDDSRMSKFVPTEIFACSYKEGKGPSDLDAAIEDWSQHMDGQSADAYAAWTLTRQYYSSEQDFDVLWLGAWKDGNAMGQGRDRYHATGDAVRAGFSAVVGCTGHAGYVSWAYKLPTDDGAPTSDSAVFSFTNCEVKEGATYDSVVEGLKGWANVLGESGSKAAIYQWWPVYGGGDEDFDFKIITVYPNYAEQGADLERVGNGELWRKRMELVGDQFDCNVSRVYDGKLRRGAKLR
jgi:hypothetical protein